MLLVNVENIKEARSDCTDQTMVKLYRFFRKSGDDEWFDCEDFDKDGVSYIEKGEVIHVHYIPKSKVEAYKAMDDDEKAEFLETYDEAEEYFYEDFYANFPYISWDFSTEKDGWTNNFEKDREKGLEPVYAYEDEDGVDSSRYFDDDVEAIENLMYRYKELAKSGKIDDIEKLKLHVWLVPDNLEESEVDFDKYEHLEFTPDIYDWDWDFYSDHGNSVKLDFYEV